MEQQEAPDQRGEKWKLERLSYIGYVGYHGFLHFLPLIEAEGLLDLGYSGYLDLYMFASD